MIQPPEGYHLDFNGEEEPDIRWEVFEDLFAQAHLKGEHSDVYMDILGETERVGLFLHYKPYGLLVGRPRELDSDGIRFWIARIPLINRPDIPRQLFAALAENEKRLFIQEQDALRQSSRTLTSEVLQEVEEGYLIPFPEFTRDFINESG